MLGIIFKALFPFIFFLLHFINFSYLLYFSFSFFFFNLFSLVSLQVVSCPFSVVVVKANKRLIQDLGE